MALRGKGLAAVCSNARRAYVSLVFFRGAFSFFNGFVLACFLFLLSILPLFLLPFLHIFQKRGREGRVKEGRGGGEGREGRGVRREGRDVSGFVFLVFSSRGISFFVGCSYRKLGSFLTKRGNLGKGSEPKATLGLNELVQA